MVSSETDRHVNKQTDSTEIITYPHTRMVITCTYFDNILGVWVFVSGFWYSIIVLNSSCEQTNE